MSELKAILATPHPKMKNACDGAIEVYPKSEADEVIAELEMKLAAAQLAQRLNKPEALFSNLETMGRLSHERDVVARRERKLKRALWLARAERAHVTTLLWNVYCYQNNCLYFRDFMNVKCNPFRNLPKKTAMEWSDLWESIETKCLAKVDKYK